MDERIDGRRDELEKGLDYRKERRKEPADIEEALDGYRRTNEEKDRRTDQRTGS